MNRTLIALPCLTAVALLAGCSTTPASLPFNVAAAPTETVLPVRKLPAVPPLSGPVSPLLQLGLVTPTRRPDGLSMMASRKADQFETVAEVPASTSDVALNRDESGRVDGEPQVANAAPVTSTPSAEPFDVTMSVIDTISNDEPLPITRVSYRPVALQVATAMPSVELRLAQVASAPAQSDLSQVALLNDLALEEASAAFQMAQAASGPAPLQVASNEPAHNPPTDRSVDTEALAPIQVASAEAPIEPRRKPASPLVAKAPVASGTAAGGPELPIKLRK